MGHQSISEDNLDEVDFYEHLAHGGPARDHTQPPLDRIAPPWPRRRRAARTPSVSSSPPTSAVPSRRPRWRGDGARRASAGDHRAHRLAHRGHAPRPGGAGSGQGRLGRSVRGGCGGHRHSTLARTASSSSPLRWSTCAAAVASGGAAALLGHSLAYHASPSRRPTFWPPSTRRCARGHARERDRWRFLSRYREPAPGRNGRRVLARGAAASAPRQPRSRAFGGCLAELSCPYLPDPASTSAPAHRARSDGAGLVPFRAVFAFRARQSRCPC